MAFGMDAGMGAGMGASDKPEGNEIDNGIDEGIENKVADLIAQIKDLVNQLEVAYSEEESGEEVPAGKPNGESLNVAIGKKPSYSTAPKSSLLKRLGV